MSIYIEGVTMPKRCGECPCFHAENPMYCQAVKADKNKKIIAPYGKPKPDWCPLAPVHPHGRLIDADVILNGKAFGTQIAGFGKMFHESVIEYAPTVIQAESEGE